jgi:hypothetical protein
MANMALVGLNIGSYIYLFPLLMPGTTPEPIGCCGNEIILFIALKTII